VHAAYGTPLPGPEVLRFSAKTMLVKNASDSDAVRAGRFSTLVSLYLAVPATGTLEISSNHLSRPYCSQELSISFGSSLKRAEMVGNGVFLPHEQSSTGAPSIFSNYGDTI
jgi:hypothetical protein